MSRLDRIFRRPEAGKVDPGEVGTAVEVAAVPGAAVEIALPLIVLEKYSTGAVCDCRSGNGLASLAGVLEQAYRKLGVGSRTAALARLAKLSGWPPPANRRRREL